MAKIGEILIFCVALLYKVNAIDFIVAAPRIFRLGVVETVAVTVTDAPDALPMSIYFQTTETNSPFSRQNFVIDNGNPMTVQIKMNPANIPKQQLNNKIIYAKLVTECPACQVTKREIIIPFVKYSGYVFIQTDKPIYTPGEEVKIRVLVLDEKLLPSDSRFLLDIRNPNGLSVKQEDVVPDRSGINERSLKLPRIPILGAWDVSVSYGYKNSANKTIQFEVKEYVLPTFSVTIEAPSYVLPEDETITGKIKARYVYGKPVIGKASIKFYIQNSAGVRNFQNMFSRELIKGEFQFEVHTDEIKENMAWFPEIQNSRLLIEANVVETATGYYEKKMHQSTLFTEKPYTIDFEESIKNFMPGVFYRLQVTLKDANGKPATKIPVVINKAQAKQKNNSVRNLPAQVRRFTDEFGKVIIEYDTNQSDVELILEVQTDQDTLLPHQQATKELTVPKYTSPVANSYVWIKIPAEFLIIKPGTVFTTQVIVYPSEARRIFVLVVSRGKILLSKETASTGDALFRTISFTVTPEMSPISRLVVYYIKDNRIIADSVRLTVQRKCTYNNGEGIQIHIDSEARPGKNLELSIKGEKNSYVATVAVDEAVYLLSNYEKLTKEKMFEELQKSDLGCGPGSGKTTEAVFKNAGLIIVTSAIIGDINSITDSDCKGTKRIKRSTDRLERKFSLYERKCCEIGWLPPAQINMTCEERADIIHKEMGEEDKNCSVAFMICCQNFTTQHQLGRAIDIMEIDFSKVPDSELEDWEKQIQERTDFPETWLFHVHLIGRDCADNNADTCVIKTTLPHSITTWRVQAIGVSRTTGICIADPIQIKAFKPFFLQLGMPYSVKRGEQIEIKATVFNYLTEKLNVLVYMYGVEGICMNAEPGQPSKKYRLSLNPNSAKSVSFPMMPLQVADYDIRVVAIGGENFGDIIVKRLKVVPEGVPKVVEFSAYLDPAAIYRRRSKRQVNMKSNWEESFPSNDQQTLVLDLTPPEDFVKGSDKCIVSAAGDVVGQAIETSISDIDKFITQPSGCGEQNMALMAPTVYTMSYLKRTKRLTSASERNGYQYINEGYTGELKYRKPDGSFAIFPDRDSNTWLTAFVAKVFCQARSFIKVATEVACGAVNWLVNRQRSDGAFYEGYSLYDKGMMGGVKGDAAFTAFILISMLECSVCGSEIKRNSVARAVKYLELQFDNVHPFHVPIITYALTLAKSSRQKEANEKLRQLAIFNEDSNIRFWPADSMDEVEQTNWAPGRRATAVTIEATSYGLLTQLLNSDIEYSHAIVNWLSQQRSSGGSFVSTQDTVVGLQALTEYSAAAEQPPLNLTCIGRSEASSKYNFNFMLNDANSLVLYNSEIPAKGNLVMDVKGKGVGALTVAMHYNIKPKPEDLCQFDLKVKPNEYEAVLERGRPEHPDPVIRRDILRRIVNNTVLKTDFGIGGPECDDAKNDIVNCGSGIGEKQSVLELEICARYHGNENTNMAILEIGLVSGYAPWIPDLQKLKNEENSQVSEFEVSDVSVVLYLDEISNSHEDCVNFRTVKVNTVGKVQPTAVKVYDYYEPSKSCSVFYAPDGRSPLMRTICESDTCICTEGKCPECNPFEDIKKNFDVKNRQATLLRIACSEHDFVWLGNFTKKETKGNYNYFHYEIEEVMKEGIQIKAELQEKSVIFTHVSSCLCPVIELNKRYVLMGRDGFQVHTDDGIKYRYTLNSKSKVYEMRPLRNLDAESQNLQKAFNSLYVRMVIRKEGCDL